MKIIVGGINGSGKTTILNKLLETNHSYKIIGSSKAFSNWLGFGGDYEKLRSLDPKDRDIKLALFMEETLSKNDDFLLDSHYMNLVRGVITSTTGSWIKNFDALILISADLDIVWNRITQDKRDRALFPNNISENEAKEILNNYQKQYKEEFLRVSEKYNLPHIEIKNYTIEDSVADLSNYISTLERSGI